MSDHTRALIPTETWWYASPDLQERGIKVDIGLFAEALVYYDQLLVSAGNASQFAGFVEWFTQRDLLSELLRLIKEGTIQFYDYAFFTNPFVNGPYLKLYNLKDRKMDEPNSFPHRILEDPEVVKAFPDRRSRAEFCRLVEGKVIEAKADDFASAIANAEEDFVNPKRGTFLLQTLLDEAYSVKNLGRAPIVQGWAKHDRRGEVQVKWSMDLDPVAKRIGLAGIDYRVSPEQSLTSLVLSGAGHANRLLLSAMQNGIDLYLPRPLSIITGDKLYEAALEETAKVQDVIDLLQVDVEFPDLRNLINKNEVAFNDVLSFRKKGKPFRDWLQDEAERERDALIAYHNEVAKEAGFIRGVRKTLSLFGKLGGGALGSVLGSEISQDPTVGGAIGAFLGDKISYLAELSSNLSKDWKPVVFGDWYKKRITKILEARESRDKLINPLGLERAKRREKQKQLRKAQRNTSLVKNGEARPPHEARV